MIVLTQQSGVSIGVLLRNALWSFISVLRGFPFCQTEPHLSIVPLRVLTNLMGLMALKRAGWKNAELHNPKIVFAIAKKTGFGEFATCRVAPE